MRPSWLMISVLLHSTAVGAVLGFAAYAQSPGPTPPARVQIKSTHAAVPAPPPVAVPPIEAEPVDTAELAPDVLVFDEVEPPAPTEPPVDRELAADRLPSLPLVQVRSPNPVQAEPEAESPAEPDVTAEVVPQPAAVSAPPQEYVEAHRADNTPPRYPERERLLRHEGEVLLAISVAVDGAVTDVAVRRACRYDAFNREAQRAARLWRFEPAREGGRAVASVTEVTVEFRLDDG